jgi:hypothetical protein
MAVRAESGYRLAHIWVCDVRHKVFRSEWVSILKMRCIAHIWKSPEADGNIFRLRLTSLDSEGNRAAVEGFPNESLLSKRMVELGFTTCTCKISLSNLRDEKRAIWSNCEMAKDVFVSFGDSLAESIN